MFSPYNESYLKHCKESFHHVKFSKICKNYYQRHLLPWNMVLNFQQFQCTCFGSTYTKIGTIQRRLAWPLRKDDTQNREAFHIFWRPHHLDPGKYAKNWECFPLHLSFWQYFGLHSSAPTDTGAGGGCAENRVRVS